MKRTIFSLILVVLFSGCDMYYVQTYDKYQNDEYDIRDTGMAFSNIRYVFGYVNRKLTYKKDPSNRWQAPQETVDLKTGDCEDFCIFVAYHAVQLGHSVKIVFGVKDPKKGSGHAILKLDNEYFEYTGRKIDNYLYNCEYLTLDEALSVCYNKFGSRSIE